MEPDFTAPRLLPGLGAASVLLGIGDQKGLLAACHTEDLAHIYGRRTGQEEQDNDSPDRLWQRLRLYVRDQGASLILDVEAGPVESPKWQKSSSGGSTFAG